MEMDCANVPLTGIPRISYLWLWYSSLGPQLRLGQSMTCFPSHCSGRCTKRVPPVRQALRASEPPVEQCHDFAWINVATIRPIPMPRGRTPATHCRRSGCVFGRACASYSRSSSHLERAGGVGQEYLSGLSLGRIRRHSICACSNRFRLD